MRSAHSPSSLARLLAFPVLVCVLVMACGPELTSEEKVEAQRAEYTAELTSWTVTQDPTVGDSADEEEADAEAERVADLETPEDAATPVSTEVLLDIFVFTDGEGSLPGLTVDLTQVDAEMAEKARRTLWIDTSSVRKGSGVQISHLLSDVDYAPGDMFHVEIRASVPPQERSAYREFDTP